jgi:hypothetical protein
MAGPQEQQPLTRQKLLLLQVPAGEPIMDGNAITLSAEVLPLLNPRAIKAAARHHFHETRDYNRRVGSFEEFLEFDAWGFFCGWLAELGELSGEVFPTEPSGLESNAQRAAWVVFEDECESLLNA